MGGGKDVESMAPEVLVGSGILDLVTVGMYDSPLAIYREYIQNAADAVGGATGGVKRGKVEVEIDVAALRVTVRDNGPGLCHEEAVRALLPVGDSQKRRGVDRGFRGIGRLAGLACADTVTFLTRAGSDEPVTRVAWDGTKLRGFSGGDRCSEDVILECVAVDRLSGSDYPLHFFEVRVEGIGRHAAGLALNRKAVRKYISEVCPVPISSSFPYGARIEGLFCGAEAPVVLEVSIDDESGYVTRLENGMIPFSEARTDHFRDFEDFRVPSVDGKDSAAIGWVAHSSYLGAIPKEIGMRGLRARVGNIQIGDESVFDRVFLEERFNRWCVGEVHIVDPRIVPNARRDYFEPGPHVRNLENQIGRIARRIAVRCRTASTARNKDRRLQSVIEQLEETYDLATSGYLARDDAARLVGLACDRVQDIREQIGTLRVGGERNLGQLDAVEMRLRSFEPPCESKDWQGVAGADAAIYRRVFRTLTEICSSPRAARELIEAVLARV